MYQRILVPWAIPEAGKEVLKKSRAEIIFLHGPRGEQPGVGELEENVKNADVLLSRGTQLIPKSVVAANPNLLGISNFGVGYDNVDMVTATQLGIPVANTPGILTETTADLAWALLMATARRIPQAHNYITSGQWKGPGGKVFMGFDIGPGGSNKSKVLGVIGFGRIGQTMIQRSRGFKMKVLVYDPLMTELIKKSKGVEYRELGDLLRESDFITIHCPLTEETHHLIGKKELDLMKSTAVLINTARGPIVDEKALVSALKKGKIAGAGLDVFEKEPKLTAGLSKLVNVVLLPHLGSFTKDTRDQMAITAAKNAFTLLRRKRPAHIVNPDVLDSPEYHKKLKL